MLVCTGVLVLRYTEPERPRPFRIGGGWVGVFLVTVCGAAACLYVMKGLPGVTWARFTYWLYWGLVIYLEYGFTNSTLRGASRAPSTRPRWQRVTLLLIRLVAYVLLFVLLFRLVSPLFSASPS